MPKRRLLALGLLLTICGLLFAPLGQIAPADAAVHQLTAHGISYVNSFSISPDGQRIVYVLQHAGTNRLQLYSVPVTGGAPAMLASALAPSPTDISPERLKYTISPDSRRVLYLGLPPTAPTPTPSGTDDPMAGLALYSAPIDGSGPSTLIADDPNVYYYLFSANSQTAIFLTDTVPGDGAVWLEIFAKSLAGGGVRKLSLDLAADQHIYFPSMEETYKPLVVFDSGHLVYSVTGAQGLELYSVPVSGVAAQNIRISPCGADWGVIPLADGLHMVTSLSDCAGDNGIFKVTATGSEPVRLSPPTVVNAGAWLVTEDQRFVVFNGNCQTITQPSTPTQWTCDLFVAPLAGPVSDTRLIVNGTLDGANPVGRVVAAPNGDWLALLSRVYSPVSTTIRLYVASRTATPNTARLLDTLSRESYVYHIAFGSDSQDLVYHGSDNAFYTVQLPTQAAPLPLGFSSQDDVFRWQSNPNTSRLLFDAGHAFTLPAAGPASALLTVSHQRLSRFTHAKFTPDGRKVVYISGQLFIADVDQPATGATPAYVAWQGCTNGYPPIATAGPTRTPFPTQFALYIPNMQLCHPLP